MRAVSMEALNTLLSSYRDVPIHMHIAEQQKEVRDCLDAFKLPPVAHLLSFVDVNANWCLIHATHMKPFEVTDLASTGAVVGLCPTTEGNLGDGFFELRHYLAERGAFGIGSDSNASRSPFEELRFLEYSQRLKHQERNISAGLVGSSGETLYSKALAGGAQALGQKVGQIKLGYGADLLLLDSEHPQLIGHKTDHLLDALIFSGTETPIKQIMVAGKWLSPEKYQPEFGKVLKHLKD
ncbi:MAG: amidohydrolase family protein [Deinococcales bacterium]